MEAWAEAESVLFALSQAVLKRRTRKQFHEPIDDNNPKNESVLLTKVTLIIHGLIYPGETKRTWELHNITEYRVPGRLSCISEHQFSCCFFGLPISNRKIRDSEFDYSLYALCSVFSLQFWVCEIEILAFQWNISSNLLMLFVSLYANLLYANKCLRVGSYQSQW